MKSAATDRVRLISSMCAAAMLSVAGVAGCESSPSSKVVKPKPAAAAPIPRGTAPIAGGVTSAVSRMRLSELREAALQRVETLARSNDPQVRANAVEAATSASNRLKGVIGDGMIDNNAGVRAVALMTVGRQEMSEMLGRVAGLASDPSPYVRAAALYAQARCGKAANLSPLAEMLMTDASTNLRGHAAFLLGEIGDRSALPLLKDAARQSLPLASASERNKLQLQIAEAMVKLGEAGYVEGIRAALFPATPEELESMALAVQILGELRDRGSVGQLINMSEYRNRENQQYPAEIRLGIAGALAKMSRDQGGFIADEYAGNPIVAVRAQAALTYGLTGRVEHAEKLAVLMNDAEAIVQIHAAAGILKIYERAAGADAGR